MSSLEDHWSKAALDALAELPGHLRDQVETLVREICRDPRGPVARAVPSLDRTWVAEICEVAVFYQIAPMGEFILINRVAYRP